MMLREARPAAITGNALTSHHGRENQNFVVKARCIRRYWPNKAAAAQEARKCV
jgi:hypothetical protein